MSEFLNALRRTGLQVLSEESATGEIVCMSICSTHAPVGSLAVNRKKLLYYCHACHDGGHLAELYARLATLAEERSDALD